MKYETTERKKSEKEEEKYAIPDDAKHPIPNPHQDLKALSRCAIDKTTPSNHSAHRRHPIMIFGVSDEMPFWPSSATWEIGRPYA